ncbi:helix-turn-helix domain-containing protein [Spirosoma fluminis]
MTARNIDYRISKPAPQLADFVESLWMLANHSADEQAVVVLPDGRIDIFFSVSAVEPYHVVLLGLGSEASPGTLAPDSVIFAVSFKPLGVEYILQTKISSLINEVQSLPADFWGLTDDDLTDFDQFCDKVSEKMKGLLDADVDERKRKLFNLMYAANGAVTIKELSDSIQWSSRQLNRYFNQWFGLSVKAYCNILRYRASFGQIKEGKLFPEQNFTDQAHFIKEVKRYSGVTPKELARNANDRFIQFSTLPQK